MSSNNHEGYVQYSDHEKKISDYQHLVSKCVKKIESLSKDKVLHGIEIDELTSKLSAYSKKLKQLNVKVSRDDTSIFKMVNDVLMKDAGLNSDQAELYRQEYRKKLNKQY